MAETRAKLIADRIRERVWTITKAVPPIDPEPCYWLHSDATESFCREHVIEARAQEFELGAPLSDRPFYERTEMEDAFFEGIGASEDSESEHAEACARCGKTLSYILTDYGVADQIDYYREAPLVALRDEDSYALDRLSLNIWPGAPRHMIVGVAIAVNQAWRLLPKEQAA